MLVKEIELNNGNKLEIFQNDTPESPREYFSNATKMIFFHKRLNVGDKHNINPDNYTSYGAIAQECFGENDIVMPVFAYSKRAFELSLTPFSCPWDSGQVGFIVVDEITIKVEFGGDKIKALNNLKVELETYNDYLNGRTYGYRLEDSEGHEIDTCWGFYGTNFEENGIYDNAGINRMDVVEELEVR